MITRVVYQENEMTLIRESAHFNEPFFTEKKTIKTKQIDNRNYSPNFAGFHMYCN